VAFERIKKMERNVVLAGWGQITQAKHLHSHPKNALGLMESASLQAFEMTGQKPSLTGLDGVMVVSIVSGNYPAAAQQLANILGTSPKFTCISGIGGNSPQTLINMAAGMISRGELDSILIAGAETYVQRQANAKKVESALFRGVPEDYPGDDLIGSTPLENRHGIEHPMQGFPLFETALWAASGLDINSYRTKVGKMWASFSEVAASNPLAWTRAAKTAQEIITPGPDNRPVAFPYTKFMNSFVTVDQGAAVLLMAEEKAAACSSQAHQKVYFLGGGYAEDRQRFMIEKSDFTSSPPLREAVDKALTRSTIPLEKIQCFDFYSCFPCAVSIAKKMTGLSDHDPRTLTLTGGLGFFGGPGNNYSLHSIATLAEKIACGTYSNGLITALGWFMHKHAAGVYGAEPRPGGIKDYDLEDKKSPLCGGTPEIIQEEVNGTGFIQTYTVVFSRDRTPAYAVIYGKTHEGLRFIARTPDSSELFSMLMKESQVGKKVKIKFDSSKNINIAELIWDKCLFTMTGKRDKLK
jgi:acetyl-CoA C-acetyltransferase